MGAPADPVVKRAFVGIALLLAGCATPGERIAAKLVGIGVPDREARCMGDRLAKRLTTAQLLRLGRMPGLDRITVGRMSLTDIVRRIDAVGDPALVAEVVRAGVGCAL